MQSLGEQIDLAKKYFRLTDSVQIKFCLLTSDIRCHIKFAFPAISIFELDNIQAPICQTFFSEGEKKTQN